MPIRKINFQPPKIQENLNIKNLNIRQAAKDSLYQTVLDSPVTKVADKVMNIDLRSNIPYIAKFPIMLCGNLAIGLAGSVDFLVRFAKNVLKQKF